MTPQIITRAEREVRKKEAAKASFPSNWQMLKNLVQAAGDVLEKGINKRTPEEIEAALKICAGCEKLVVDKGRARCGQCGCFLGGFDIATWNLGPQTKTLVPQFGKVLLKAWKCPLGKW